MAYRRRGESEADLYHVFARGTGRRIIFEDDSDRAEYLRRMGAILPEIPGSLHAWCLMGNHVHFVVRMRMDALSMFVKARGNTAKPAPWPSSSIMVSKLLASTTPLQGMLR